MKIRFTAPARLELNEAFDYYESCDLGLGDEFLDEVEAAMGFIRQWPEA